LKDEVVNLIYFKTKNEIVYLFTKLLPTNMIEFIFRLHT